MMPLLFQQMIDIPLLIAATLKECRWSHLKSQFQRITLNIQISLGCEQIQTEKPYEEEYSQRGIEITETKMRISSMSGVEKQF